MNRLTWLTELPSRYPRLARIAPATAFFGGFLWDAVTLGSRITSFDLFWVLGYYLVALIVLVLIGREIESPYSPWFNVALQFLFGGIFSPLVVFYFLSSGELWGFLVVAILVGLLVGNEFLESRYSALTLSWTIFAVCGIMFFNFSLPHLFTTLNPLWFYLSTAFSLVVVFLLRMVSTRQASIVPSVVIALVLAILYSTNIIPPVPLVKKELVIAHDVAKKDGRYEVLIEPAPPWKFWLRSSPTFHLAVGERIYCFTAVFVPKGLVTTLRHRWEIHEPGHGWRTTDVISFQIRGGRESGYRGFTWKERTKPGAWRILVEAPDGRILSSTRFEVIDASAGDLGLERLKL